MARGDPDPQRHRPDSEPQRWAEVYRLAVNPGMHWFWGGYLPTRRAPHHSDHAYSRRKHRKGAPVRPHHVNIRLEEHKLCLLVMIGVRADGRKELVALADGYRESAESWADLLRDCARRGMRAPVLAVGDGALGFWNALREVFPQAREGRCWFHRPQMSWRRCPGPLTRGPRRPWPRSGAPRTTTTPGRR